MLDPAQRIWRSRKQLRLSRRFFGVAFQDRDHKEKDSESPAQGNAHPKGRDMTELMYQKSNCVEAESRIYQMYDKPAN